MAILFKPLLGLVSLLIGISVIGVPIAMNSSSNKLNDQKDLSLSAVSLENSYGGGHSEEDNIAQFKSEDLKNLSNLTTSLFSNGQSQSEQNVKLQKKEGEWVWANKELFTNLGLSDGEDNNSTYQSKIEKALEYILREWGKSQWGSSWSGEYWGTSWNINVAGAKNVVMSGRDEGNLKNVLLKLNLTENPKQYIIGTYESKTSSDSKKYGVLNLGLGDCKNESAPQCEIPKTKELSNKRITIQLQEE